MEYYSLLNYNYKVITPYDFLDSEFGIPIQLFQVKSDFGVYSSIPKKEDPLDQNRLKKAADIIFKVSVKEYTPKMVDDLGHEKMMIILCTILEKSLNKCNTIKTVSLSIARYIDQTAVRYSKTPIEVLFPCGGYNELDAYLFNMFIENIAVNEENSRIKRKR